MQGAFIQSLTYCAPAILGRQLLPFSPWHGIVLEGAGSPYIIGGKPDFDDVVTAVWVCSHSFTHGWEGTLDLVAAKKWGKANRKHRAQFPAAAAAFNEHILASFVGPEYWPAEGGSSVKAPYWWHMATFGMSTLHLPYADAWDCSIARLMCHFACKSETEGGKGLMSTDDINGIEVLRADVAKEKAAKKGVA